MHLHRNKVCICYKHNCLSNESPAGVLTNEISAGYVTVNTFSAAKFMVLYVQWLSHAENLLKSNQCEKPKTILIQNDNLHLLTFILWHPLCTFSYNYFAIMLTLPT